MAGPLEACDLTKRYVARPAVDCVSFTLSPGQVTGYVGPNGSGKSTTAKMLTGLMRPTSGRVLYRGAPIANDLIAYKRVLGYVPEEPYLYSHLTGLEYLELVGQLRGIPQARLREKIAEFLRLLELEEDRHSPLSSYSKGMRQKILISGALLHNPEVVILDEPFSGLDVGTTLVLKRLIQGLGQAGKIVLYSSHVLEVVEKVCSRVIILDAGRVVANESVSGLRALMNLPTLEEIFSRLVIEDNPDKTAASLIEVMEA